MPFYYFTDNSLRTIAQFSVAELFRIIKGLRLSEKRTTNTHDYSKSCFIQMLESGAV